MNIFKILSRGRGKVSETNVSAFLAFLLNPYEQHGFGKLFLCNFLNHLNEIIKTSDNKKLADGISELYVNDEITVELLNKFFVSVSVEKPLEKAKEKYGYIDVLLEIKDLNNNTVLKLLIEIKINDNAIQGKTNGKNDDISQLVKYLKFIDGEDNSCLVFIALNSSVAKDAVEEITDRQKLFFITWDDINKILSKIILQNTDGVIDPIHHNTLNLLISFKQFIASNFSDDSDPKQMKYRVEFTGKTSKVVYSNFAGQTILMICKEIFSSGNAEKLIQGLNDKKKSITSFKHLIASSQEYENYKKEKTDAAVRFFDKDNQILESNNEKWYLTSEYTEQSLFNFQESFGKDFNFKVMFLKKRN